MAKLGKFDVEIEYLDRDGNVYDSHCVLLTDSYDEAYDTAMKTDILPDEQVAIWEWNDAETAVIDSQVVKTFEVF